MLYYLITSKGRIADLFIRRYLLGFKKYKAALLLAVDFEITRAADATTAVYTR
jgi:hypothetical protein